MNDRARDLSSGLAAFLVPFLVGLAVHSQGFNLLDDGLWLLGGRLVSEGGVLYRDLFSIYGPARYLILVPFLWTVGQKVVALAVMKAVIDGLAGTLAFFWCRRLGAGRWAWLAPIGVIAIAPVYPRYLAAAAFTIWCSGDPWSGRRAWATGLFWGALGLFGLDMAGYGVVVLALSWWTAARPRRPLVPLAGGGAVVVALVVAVVALSGALDAFWWDTVVYPATGFGEAMGVSWWQTAADGRVLGEVFAGRHTGESFDPVWPLQATLRALALRVLYFLAWTVPVAFFIAGRRRGDRRWTVLAALGVAGWVTLSARGDVEHLKLVTFAILLMVPVGLAGLVARHRRWGLGGLVLLVLGLGPLLAESVWLATHRGRAGVETWDHPAAGVLLAAERRGALDEITGWTTADPSTSLQVWPAQPGLHFVAGLRPAVAQATLLPGEVRDPGRLVAGLDAAAPARIVLGPAWGLIPGIRSLRRLEPAVWSNLRENYRVEREVVLMGETYKFLTRVPGGREGVLALSPALRLPGAAQYLKTGTTPAIEPGIEVAQTFRVDDFDLSGLALMFTAPGPFPYRVEFELAILQVDQGAAPRVLAEIPLTVILEQQAQKHSFPFRPIAGSRGRTMGIRVRDLSGGQRPFALLWHEPDAVAGGIDYHPTGTALVNGRPVGADLTFTTW